MGLHSDEACENSQKERSKYKELMLGDSWSCTTTSTCSKNSWTCHSKAKNSCVNHAFTLAGGAVGGFEPALYRQPASQLSSGGLQVDAKYKHAVSDSAGVIRIAESIFEESPKWFIPRVLTMRWAVRRLRASMTVGIPRPCFTAWWKPSVNLNAQRVFQRFPKNEKIAVHLAWVSFKTSLISIFEWMIFQRRKAQGFCAYASRGQTIESNLDRGQIGF